MKKSSYIPLYLTFFAGIFFSFFAAVLVYHFETKTLKTAFESYSRDRISVIKQSIGYSYMGIDAVCSFINSKPELSREEFKEFVSLFLSEKKVFQSIAWIPYITKEQQAKFSQAALKDGVENFRIKQKNSQDKLVESPIRNDYFPIYYIEPFNEYRMLLGFDVSTDPKLKKAILASMKIGKKVASTRVMLLKEKIYGFRIFAPVFWENYSIVSPGASFNPGSISIRGFVSGIFIPRNIVEHAIASLEPRDINIYVFDQHAPVNERLLYHNVTIPGDLGSQQVETDIPDKTEYKVISSIDMGNREWSIVCIPGPTFFSKNRTFIPFNTFMAGFIITLLLSVYIYNKITESERVRSMIQVHTRHLEISEKRLELALKGADLGLWDWNIETGALYLNDRWIEMLEYKPGEIYPNSDSWFNIIHPEDKKRVMDELNAHFNKKTPIFQSEYRLKSRSGKWKWILDTGKVFDWDENGKPLRASGTHSDITIRKMAEQQLLCQTLILKQMFKGIIFMDLEGKIIEWTQDAESMFGYMKDEIINNEFLTLVRHENTGQFLNEIISEIKQNDLWTAEMIFIHKDKTESIHEIVIVPILDEEGNIEAAIGITQPPISNKMPPTGKTIKC